ncbi:MAG: PAS domain S-box protein [Chloroflexi bacterium]|uniref:protein-glutamate O-methyltransferase n=1 Tax=Candidatus Chlorohelix allophototropha TaxID=3003348 RepID=A0A8T7LZT5_9CHLR|nr:PAS domain S-box protein [Chloroflexota bacterium]WJW66413.1 PAS domain S-box protein [Chloroflexota bacterium L227-S17]
MPDSEQLFQLVVVGASAGGIEALTSLVASLSKEFPLPLVIAQHLDPKRPSHLEEILARHTQLAVVTVTDRVKLLPGTVYVVPSNRHVQINEDEVEVLNVSNGHSQPSIDLLLTSAAQIYGEKLIAVILTGTGSDGSLGAFEVSRLGGTVIIQDPITAAFPGMPMAVSPQSVDIIADLNRIGSIISDLVAGIQVTSHSAREGELQSFLQLVREHSGLDFRSYKPATILRRIQRRIAATNSIDLKGYITYLKDNPSEYGLLVNNFLIKVTEFRRDPEFFDYLGEQILPELVEYSRAHSKELRIWSAGCATGEEAYSLAILVAEVLGEELNEFTVKIFATDLDSAAIAFARQGVYPKQSLQKFPPELIRAYFNELDNSFEIKKQVRSLVVFGEHDLGQRSPFPRIDLVVCRNVLIYFSRDLQQYALQLFAFSLRDGGFLALGKTETANPLSDLFLPEHPTHKIFRRFGQRRILQPLRFPATIPTQALPRPDLRRVRIPNLELDRAHLEVLHNRSSKETLLLNLPIGVIVVDRHFDIQEINSAARRLLGVHSAAVGEDLIHLAQSLPERELAKLITTALRDRTVTELTDVEIPHITTGEPTYLQIKCYPQLVSEESKNFPNSQALILITDITDSYRYRLELEQANNEQRNLAIQLKQSLEALKVSNKELEYTNSRYEETNKALEEAKKQAEETMLRHTKQMEILVATNTSLLVENERLNNAVVEMRRLNEEFLLRNEEAQAATEEAETLNEELQATNEELETLNEELQATIEELNTANSDLSIRTTELQKMTKTLETQKQLSEQERTQLSMILASMNDAVVVVRPEGTMLVTNEAYREQFVNSNATLFNQDRKTKLTATTIPQARAARGEKFKTIFTARLKDGAFRWYEAVGQPVLDSKNKFISGVVVIRDITERKEAELALLKSNQKVIGILESISDAFFAVDSNGLITYANLQAEEILGKNQEDLLGKNILEEFPVLRESSTVHEVFNKAQKERKAVDFEAFAASTEKWYEINMYPAEDGGFTLYFGDITRRKLQEQQKLESLGLLAGGIAHDFNNMLEVVVGNLGLARMDLDDNANIANIASLRELLNETEMAAYRSRELTAKLLTFASGGAPIKNAELLPPLLEEWLYIMLRGTTIAYKLSCVEDLWQVHIDEGQINQVIQNLVLNAVQAMPSGGTLTVKAENIVHISLNSEIPLPDGNYVKVSMADEGIGIPSNILGRIFEPYFTTKEKSSGLGLTVAFSIINRHNGYLGVESELGKGTTIYFYLPVSDTEKSGDTAKTVTNLPVEVPKPSV